MTVPVVSSNCLAVCLAVTSVVDLDTSQDAGASAGAACGEKASQIAFDDPVVLAVAFQDSQHNLGLDFPWDFQDSHWVRAVGEGFHSVLVVMWEARA